MPPSTRSSKRKSLGEPKTHKKKLKLHNKKLGSEPVQKKVKLHNKKLGSEPGQKKLKLPNKKLGSKPVQGTMPLSSSNGPELKNRTVGRRVKKSYVARTSISTPIHELRRVLSIKQIGESALSDYNKQHGTDLEYLRPLDDKNIHGPGYTIDFDHRHAYWKHFNFEARSFNADPSGKPLLLFAEVYRGREKFVLTSLMQVEPTDTENGCQQCCSNISHPRHGFRSDFDTEKFRESKILSHKAAVELSEFALQDYNEKQGTNLEFVRALSCNSFESTGVLMDFSKRETIWVHMNFEATRVDCNEEEEVVGLFAELYLGDDEKFVLSTLSVAEPSNVYDDGEWKKEMKIDQGLCRCCPNEIYHTWRGFRYAYNYPPLPDMI